MNGTESLTATTSTRDQEDHGYIVFDSHSSNILDADYTADASTVSSLSLSLILDEEPAPKTRARFDSCQLSCVPTEISDDDCFRALSPSDGLGRNTYVLPASNNGLDRKIPSSMLQVPVPDPMVPISLPNILPNPQCAMDPSPTSPSPKRKRIASYSTCKNELNLLFDSIEKALSTTRPKQLAYWR